MYTTVAMLVIFAGFLLRVFDKGIIGDKVLIVGGVMWIGYALVMALTASSWYILLVVLWVWLVKWYVKDLKELQKQEV